MSIIADRLSFVARLLRFFRKPWAEKVRSVRFRVKRLCNRLMPFVPLPTRLPFGGWWLAWNDVCGDAIFTGGFEQAESCFVERFLHDGMTVLDIGAHHGFYTLLASRKVGASGQVIAFEPSPRERQKLLWHLSLNRCRNVQVEGYALGNFDGEAELLVVNGKDTGCNSLHPPNVSEPTHPVRVPVIRLDEYLRQNGIERVDFIKMDVEGAELEVLKGATQILNHQPRPVWLVEVQDIRTQPWGYPAVEVIRFLEALDYSWFVPLLDGHLAPISPARERFDGNFVAVPAEQIAEVQHFVKETQTRC